MWQHRYRFFLPIVMLFSFNVMATTRSDDIQTFKQSWAGTALKLQRELDINTPLNEATIIGTHNSYNSYSYSNWTLRYVDPNQTLSLYDQLDMGVRSIELDAHWTLNNRFSHDILLCHGQSYHLACSPFDRPIIEGLQEVRDWLKANPNEVVLLYIERYLDGHEPRLAAALDNYLGEFIYPTTVLKQKNPETTGCISLPGSLTKNEVLKAGKQLIVVTKGCDDPSVRHAEETTFPQNWNDYVFAGIGNIPNDSYHFIDATITDFNGYPDCGKTTVFNADPNHTSMWRIYEDRTKLSHIIHAEKPLQDADMRDLMRCGINWPTMDMLSVNDSRLIAAIWSWAPSYPQDEHGRCAIYKAGEGIQNIPCFQTVISYACQQENTHDIKAILFTGLWANGESACQTVGGKSWHFSVPVNGEQMDVLKTSMAKSLIQEVWLNYAMDKQDHWVANSDDPQSLK